MFDLVELLYVMNIARLSGIWPDRQIYEWESVVAKVVGKPQAGRQSLVLKYQNFLRSCALGCLWWYSWEARCVQLELPSWRSNRHCVTAFFLIVSCPSFNYRAARYFPCMVSFPCVGVLRMFC